jgi:hypothetical protein
VSRVPPPPLAGKDLRAVPAPEPEELEQLEELGDDAIIAQQQGAHVPKPRAHVTEEARSVVISDHPLQGSPPSSAPDLPHHRASKRERSEKTVVIRDRKKIDELRREIERRKPKPAAVMPGVWLWVVVGVAAFLMGGLVALFATHEEESAVAPVPSAAQQAPLAPPESRGSGDPPSVSIDELPLEGDKKR